MYGNRVHCACSPSPAEFIRAAAPRRRPPAHRPPWRAVVEFLNLVLILVAAFLVLKKPERERTAFRLLVISTLLMVFLFSLATRSGLLPGLNY